MSSWLNFNESLNNIKGQITTFASSVLADDQETNAAETGDEHFQNDFEIERLTKINQELQKSLTLSGHKNGEPNANSWDWIASAIPPSQDSKDDVSYLKETTRILENEKNDLINQLEQLDLENQQNLLELVGIREKLQEENVGLKEKNSRLKQQNKSLISAELKQSAKYEDTLQANQELHTKLDETTKELSVLRTTHDTLKKTFRDTQNSEEKELAELSEKLKKSESDNKIILSELQKAKEFVKSAELKSQEDSENCQKLAFILESYERQVSSLKAELTNIKSLETLRNESQPDHELKEKLQEISCLKNQNSKLQEEMQGLRNTVQLEKESTHNLYVNVITDNVRRYIDSALLPNEHPQETSENPHITEFSRQVESIFKILLEFKEKCESLEKDLIEASNEKTEILNEKYNEIEKLIQNSEILSQEVIKKGETIKELEAEITNLITSNDVLLSELDSYKNSGLQTISESNEDNMVLLETNLENANKRIKELEEIIDSSSKSTQSRINQKPEDYQELLNSFDYLKIDYDELAYKLGETNEKLKNTDAENEDLKAHVEKIRSDFENTDYQLSEANFALDGLKEELEATKLKTETFCRENKELKLQHMSSIDLKTELNEIKEKWLKEENLRREFEAQIKTLIEKQQSTKMTETSLKLQYDTLNKEHLALTEAKNNLEQSLAKSKNTIAGYVKDYTEILEKYENVLLRCEDLSTSLHEKEQDILRIKPFEEQNQKVTDLAQQLEEKNNEIATLSDTLRNVETQIRMKDQELIQFPARLEKIQQTSQELQNILKQREESVALLQQQLQELATSRNELINMVTIKHQESINYHNEIQRLSDILKSETERYTQLEAKLVQVGGTSDEIAKKNEDIDRLADEVNFLKGKCDVLTKNLLEEQSKQSNQTKQLERLQSHLMDLEERSTQELLQAEQQNAKLQAKVTDLEKREKNSSTMYTSVSIRANQQVETLQGQLQMMTNQREELRKKISDAEDLSNKQTAALANLQFVLEQFQKDKEKDVQKETERIRRQINAEKQVQHELKKETDNLRGQLEESKIGLQAASRLSDQLELLKKQNSGLKDEVSQLQQKLSKSQYKIHDLTSQTDGKVDKSLIKNLIVGFLSSSNTSSWNKDQTQILKLIATVLDFNQQDHGKVKLNRPQQSSIPSPHASNQSMSHESLSQAFIRFLENESKPRVVPSLLDDHQSNRPNNSSESSKRTTPRDSPIVLNKVVLPTFADFGQSRNSSSILKDILKDNNT